MSFALRQRPFAVGAVLVFATTIAFAKSAPAQEPLVKEGEAAASQPATAPASQPSDDGATPEGRAAGEHEGHKHGDHEHGAHKHEGHHRGHHAKQHQGMVRRGKAHHRRHRRQMDLCRQGNPALAQGPLGSTYQAGAFGAVRRLCPRTDVGIFTRAPVTAEIGEELFVDLVGGAPDFVTEALRGREQFYVNAAAGTGVALAWSPVERVELFLEIEALRAQYIRASVTSTALGFGHLSPGATVVLSQSPTHAVGVTGRAQLPTATGFYKNVFPFGLDAGVSGALRPYSFLRLHGYVGGSGAVAVGPVADARAGLVAVSGVEILPFDWLSFVADLNSRLLYEDPLDHLSVALGVRAAVFSTVGLEFVAMAPLVGAERGLGAVMARATWRLGDLSVRRLLKGDVMWDEALFYRTR